jgi:hypothetical protein
MQASRRAANPATGVRHRCSHDGADVDTVCTDDCTGKSHGNGSCAGCFQPGVPECPVSAGFAGAPGDDPTGTYGCGGDDVACKNSHAGFMLRCQANKILVECVCDPDAG